MHRQVLAWTAWLAMTPAWAGPILPDGVAREKRESLDGVRWELVRQGNELTAYGPDAHALAEAKLATQRLFPELLPDSPAELTTGYSVRQLEQDRVAGYDCHWTALEPRDNARYAYHFCIA